MLPLSISGLAPKTNIESSNTVISSLSSVLFMSISSMLLFKRMFGYPKIKLIYSTIFLCELMTLSTPQLIEIHQHTIKISNPAQEKTTEPLPKINEGPDHPPSVYPPSYLFATAFEQPSMMSYAMNFANVVPESIVRIISDRVKNDNDHRASDFVKNLKFVHSKY
jgi:hypothetical protein